MSQPDHPAVRGLLAGFLAATAVVLWFLGTDLLMGEAFRTPAFMAGALFGIAAGEAGFGAILLYSVLHYAAFLVFGAVAGWMLNKVELVTPLLAGLVVGFLLFDIVFYASVLVTGVNVVDALGWPQVLAGNLIAGIVLVESLRLIGVATATGWRKILDAHQIVREGLVAGLLGAGAVAASFLVIDTLFREPLFTPAALGSALIFGVDGSEQVAITAATVLGYTLLHVTVFVVIGLVAAALVTQAEDEPALLLGFVLVFVTFEVLFLGLVAIVAAWILDTLGWWNVLIGNVVAAILMTGYLGREHPALWRLLRKESLEVPVP